jgi:DDE family transposase
MGTRITAKWTQVAPTSRKRISERGHDHLVRKRSIVETIIDQLKNISQIEHSRHRSLTNFMVNLVCGLIAYCHQPKKPSLALALPQLEALIPN